MAASSAGRTTAVRQNCSVNGSENSVNNVDGQSEWSMDESEGEQGGITSWQTTSRKRGEKRRKDRSSNSESSGRGDDCFKCVIRFGEAGGVSKKNPIKLTKVLNDTIGRIEFARVLPDGNLLVGCTDLGQVGKALKVKSIGGVKVVSANRIGVTRAKSRKGVITKVAVGIGMEEFMENIKGGNVLSAYRMKSWFEGTKIDTETVVLEFQEHEYGKCATGVQPKCCNCGEAHSAAYRGCQVLKQEVEIQKVRVEKKLSYVEAVKQGYIAIRQDRQTGSGGGCATFIKNGMQYRLLRKDKVNESMAVSVWCRNKEVTVINYYNPCQRLELDGLLQLQGQERSHVIWCGDFNAHNTLWGGGHTESNGQVVEALLEENDLVCLNDGRGTRYDVCTGRKSVLDLTLVSNALASKSIWDVWPKDFMGSDHFPVVTSIQIEKEQICTQGRGRWVLEKADWKKFMEISEQLLGEVDVSQDVDEVNHVFCSKIVQAASRAIPKSKGTMKRVAVPWWTPECTAAIKERNKAYRILEKSHNFDNMIAYKKAQALVKKIIRKNKRGGWKSFCGKIGRTTPVSSVWNMIKKMGGQKREWGYPVLEANDRQAVTDKEKSEMMVETFVKVHGSGNLSDESKRRRELTARQWRPLLEDVNGMEDHPINLPFSSDELHRALTMTGNTSPGKDEVSYAMLRNLGEVGILYLLELYNRVWREGKLPRAWKEAVIVPIRKPGKDPTVPSNYRPIALTSNVCKVMERMVVERLSYYLEKNELLSVHQSGFRKGRGTMDPIICLENEVRRAQKNQEAVLAVFFDVEKAYDMMWREGLMIKLRKIGVKGRMFLWIQSFMNGRTIQVRVGNELSRCVEVENGTPQGSVISPLIFSLMINDVFSNVRPDVGKSLFADDGALWKRGRHLEHMKVQMQEAINKVEQWGYDWGFKFSIEKTNTVLFTKKRRVPDVSLQLYGRNLEREVRPREGTAKGNTERRSNLPALSTTGRPPGALWSRSSDCVADRAFVGFKSGAMKIVIFICVFLLITRTGAQSVPPECATSPTNRLPEKTDITVTCGTKYMDLSILLCPLYNANFNESLLYLNSLNRAECRGTADFSVEPPVLRYRLSIDEQSVSACNNSVQITDNAGTGEFADFSNVQFVTISGIVVTFDPSTGLITYRPQVTYLYSCRYPLMYVMSNAQLAVAGVNVAMNENNGSFIQSLKFSLYSNENYNESLQIPETGLPIKTDIYAEVSASSLADGYNVMLLWCLATVNPHTESADGYDLFVGCNVEPNTKLGQNGVSDKAQFSFQAFRFVEHQNLEVSTFYLHCYTSLCQKDQCASMRPNCTDSGTVRRRRDVTDSYGARVTSLAIKVEAQATASGGGAYSSPVVAVIVCVVVLALLLVGMGAYVTWIHKHKVPL
ncbi:hypothetical protein WMY93_020262 [Mugilogobius chulae]|uniref:Uncharacterized protein n=1 Tax=Mugilogobius chulae TaxID=88201 RepID=A0AAW0NME6_9GOBI